MLARILHISDLHFGPPFLPGVAEALLQTIPLLAPDAIVVSGDLTQRAKRHQFEEARRFFDRMSDYPMLIIPGNHDVALWRIHERLVRPHALYREIISPELNPVLHVGNAVLVGLDSTAPRRSISNGRLDRHQLEHSEKVFAEVTDDKVRIVVAHHQFAPGHDRVFDIAMPGAQRAIDYFVEQKVEMIIVQCGTTTSSRGKGRERNENTFNLIETGSQTLTVTHYLYFEERGKFAPLSKHSFPRPGRELEVAEFRSQAAPP
jgi:Icc-related predicted phosphoesterase